MGRLFSDIREAVLAGRYAISEHAVARLEERRILEWQAVDGMSDARLLTERPHDQPHASVEVLETLPDGVQVKAVWSWLPYVRVAKLVTIHFLDQR